MEPYIKQLKPGAEKDMIKACSKLAYMKIRRNQKKTKKRKHETSSSASSSTSSSSSTQDTSDEDMFQDKKRKKHYRTTKISQTQMSSDDHIQEHDNRDPLQLSDTFPSDSD